MPTIAVFVEPILNQMPSSQAYLRTTALRSIPTNLRPIAAADTVLLAICESLFGAPSWMVSPHPKQAPPRLNLRASPGQPPSTLVQKYMQDIREPTETQHPQEQLHLSKPAQ